MSKNINPTLIQIIFQIILISFLSPIYSIIYDTKTLNNILLQEINKYRNLHNARKLSSDSKIINDAQVYAESLSKNSDPNFLIPSDTYYESDKKYGENLFQCNKKFCKTENISYVINLWYNESINYDYKLNKGLNITNNFTQMIWKGTKKMGCGIGYRDNEDNYKVVCFFYPKGNIEGKFEENVLIGNNTKKEEEIIESNIEYKNYEDYISDRSFYINMKEIYLFGVILCILLLM